MKENKFRAWDGVNMSRNTVLMTMVQNDFSLIDDDVIWMQYTGLKDKNGKEIYEGDIYTQGDKNIKYVVIFSDAQFVGRQVGNKSLAGLSYFMDKIEIIGNIHESPELLESK